MRQGPDYHMLVNHIHESINIPLELMYDFEGVECVKWTSNTDGTYTITLLDPAGN